MWPFLASEAFDFADGHAFDADLAQGVLNLFEFERFDNRFNFFHLGDKLSASDNRTKRLLAEAVP